MTEDQNLALQNLLIDSDDRVPAKERILDFASYRASAPLPLRPLVCEYLLHIDGITQRYDRSAVDDELYAAAETLARLPPSARLGDPNSDQARAALLRLVDALESSTLSETEAAKRLITAVRGHDASLLMSDIGRTIVQFAIRTATDRRNAVATFSLILFDDLCHDGAVLQSYIKQASAWRAALRPQRPAPDSHLAVIPPPPMREGVRALAATLGLTTELPCVVFLGHDIENIRQPLTRMTRRQLVRDRPYPQQLIDIYRTVYDEHALFAGASFAAAFDAFYDRRIKPLNPWELTKALVGFLAGKGAANMIATGENLTRPENRE